MQDGEARSAATDVANNSSVPVVAYDGPSPRITATRRDIPRRWTALKRIADVGIASVGLIVSAPILLPILCVIPFVSAGNPIFTQRRIGLHGRTFPMHKIRTMHVGSHLVFEARDRKQQNDPRVFAFGSFLRKTSLDELPNLVNVLLGHMSIVGPRPMLQQEHQLCSQRHGEIVSAHRLSVRPGLTGLWQVSGRANLLFDDRVRLDATYASTWTPASDLRIIAKTIPSLLRAKGAF